MNRDYADGTAEAIEFFTGLEVEHTPAYEMETLFVTGVHSPEPILAMAKENKVQHIYFGANQSFAPRDIADLKAWEHMVKNLLNAGYWCTLDFDVKYAEDILECGFNEQRKFISMISVKLPYLTQFNYNATIKLDDKDFEATNPGVWTHRLHDLLDSKVFTDWDQYKDDEILND
jgi:hypothetical protein